MRLFIEDHDELFEFSQDSEKKVGQHSCNKCSRQQGNDPLYWDRDNTCALGLYCSSLGELYGMRGYHWREII